MKKKFALLASVSLMAMTVACNSETAVENNTVVVAEPDANEAAVANENEVANEAN